MNHCRHKWGFADYSKIDIILLYEHMIVLIKYSLCCMRNKTLKVLQHMARTPSPGACTFEECIFFIVIVTFVCIATRSHKLNIFKINSCASRLSCHFGSYEKLGCNNNILNCTVLW